MLFTRTSHLRRVFAFAANEIGARFWEKTFSDGATQNSNAQFSNAAAISSTCATQFSIDSLGEIQFPAIKRPLCSVPPKNKSFEPIIWHERSNATVTILISFLLTRFKIQPAENHNLFALMSPA
jgi:hypothetical protein